MRINTQYPLHSFIQKNSSIELNAKIFTRLDNVTQQTEWLRSPIFLILDASSKISYKIFFCYRNDKKELENHALNYSLTSKN